jgi:hypothetical protein
VTKLIVRASASVALMLSAATLAFAMEEQQVVSPPAAEAAGVAPQAVVPGTPAAKVETGTEIRIPGLGKLGTLPKMDFGLELLYGAAEGKAPQDPGVDDKDDQDLTIRGSVKHKF